MKNNRNYFLKYLLRFILFVGIGMGIIFTAGACPDMVAGSGVKDQPIASATPIAFCRMYPYANDRMVYIAQEDGTIEQWSVDGNYQKKFALPIAQDDEDSAENLLWVDNEEIIWYAYDEETEDEGDYEDQHVYAAPIKRKGSGEEPDFEMARELFVCSNNLQEINGVDSDLLFTTGLGSVYADDRYLIYRSGENILYAYDRISGGQPVEISPSDEYANLPDYAYLPSLVTGDRILYHTEELGKINERLYGFWCYNLVSKELENIDDRCPSEAAYVADQTRDKVYYQIIEDQSIWEWDCQTGERRELISEEQFRRCYEESALVWDDAYYDDSMFVEGDRLYLIKNQKNPQIFSYLFTESTLYYEEKLTLAVQDSGYFHLPEKRSADYLGIAGGKLLLRYSMEEEVDAEYYDEEYYICIDLETAEGKAVGEKDVEKIYFGMLGLWQEPGTTGSWESTNMLAGNDAGPSASNAPQSIQPKPTDKTDSMPPSGSEGQNPLSIENQLACISRYIEHGMQEEEWVSDSNYFAVTDLDHNGRLELIQTSGMEGTGRFTYTNYYQLAADGQSLRKITGADGEIDIMDGFGIHTAYVDSDTGAYYYLSGDFVSLGVEGRCWFYEAIILDNGMLTYRIYADERVEWNKKQNKDVWHGYSYPDGKSQKMKKKEFQVDQLADQYFEGMEKVPAKISWFQCKGKKRNQTQEKIMEKVRRSYQKFAPQ